MYSNKRFRDTDSVGIPVDKKRKETLRTLERSLGIRFNNLSLLNLALAHRSYTNENNLLVNNERLEFLGDSVLGLTITDQLYRICNREKEGYLAKCKAHIVSEKILNQIAQTLSIDVALLIGHGEERSGGREKSAILADAMEAIIGAYYLDSGFKKASAFVLRIFDSEIRAVLKGEHNQDYKTLLQEYVQQHFGSYPIYRVVKKNGPEHKQVFWVKVDIKGESYGPVPGLNKKKAEQSVAKIAYQYLINNASANNHPHAKRKSTARSKRKRARRHRPSESSPSRIASASKKRGARKNTPLSSPSPHQQSNKSNKNGNKTTTVQKTNNKTRNNKVRNDKPPQR